MPRNSSGVYTLPELPFVTGTTIESAPVNSNFDDIGDTLTLSLATTGVSEMTGPFKAADGSLSAPSITFVNALGTGWFLSDTDEVSYVVNGVLAITYNADLSVDFEAAIGLGNTADADPLHLDWYEEGTFVPVLEFGGSSTGITYTSRTGTFTRIGNRVFFEINVQINSNGSNFGEVTVSGLPYPCVCTDDILVQLAFINNIFMGTDDGGFADDSSGGVFGLISNGDSEVQWWRRFFNEADAAPFDYDDAFNFIDNLAQFAISGSYTV